MATSWFIYVLETADGSFYTGITTDLTRREADHNSGRGAKYTAARLPVRLMAAWQAADRSHALRLEYAFKRLSRRAKQDMITLPDQPFQDALRVR